MSGWGLCECLLSHLLLLWLCIILLPDDFPEKIQRHPFYIRNSKSWPNCCCNEDKNEPVCFSGMIAATTQCSLRENTSFAIRPQYSGSHKCAYLLFQSYLKTFLGHIVLFQEKTCHGRVFFEYWLPYLLLTRLDETTLLGVFPARICNASSYFFQKTQNFDWNCCNEEKHEWVGFSGRLEAAIFQLAKMINTVLTTRSQFSGS